MQSFLSIFIVTMTLLCAVFAQAETQQDEAMRRVPPVLYSLDMPDKILSGQSHTITWSLVGYESGYKTKLAVFNCAGVASDCGSDVTTSTLNSGKLMPTSSETGPWDYNGILSTRYHYSHTFTTPTVSGDTDFVFRFYQISNTDDAAGKEVISLLIPGGLANVDYSDTSGRRIKKTVLDASTFPGDGAPKISTVTAQHTDAGTTTTPITFSVNDLASSASSLSVAVSSSNTALVPATNIFVSGSGSTRTVTATPTSNQAGTATITIAVSDGTHTSTQSFTLTVGSNLSIADASVTEEDSGSTPMDFTVTLDQASSQTVSVNYTTSNGTATAGSDYTDTSGTLTLAPGETSKTLTVPVLGDLMDEANETVTVTLSNPVNVSIDDATASGTITDNDPEPTVSFTSGAQTVNEGSIVTATLQLSQVSGMNVSVPFSVSGTATQNTDFTNLTVSPLIIPAGSSTANITFRASLDGVTDDGETVILTLDTPTYASKGATDSHTVTITNLVLTPIVPKSGQTTSYAAGDDGDLQKGVAWPNPRFTDNGNGTVTDNLTGLIWLTNANCFGGQNWDNALAQANGLASGACGLSDGSAAGDWRLPSINELESLVDAERASSALPSGHPFAGVQTSNYWSSTSYADITSYAWYVYFNSGYVDAYTSGYVDAYEKSRNNYVWPVRGGQ